MIRKIIQIDEDKCNGCGACANACHEGAIAMIDGKAKLIRDDYCDGLGDCLPTCPTGAITFVEREAAAYDEAAVKANMAAKNAKDEIPCRTSCNCCDSKLQNWPVQIKLAPIRSPYFDGANLLIAASCSSFAFADFHGKFMENKVTLIGCPKLDGVDYSEKLAEIIKANNISSVSVIRMEVPCCGGLQMAVLKAIKESGKFLPTQVVTISTEGDIIGQ